MQALAPRVSELRLGSLWICSCRLRASLRTYRRQYTNWKDKGNRRGNFGVHSVEPFSTNTAFHIKLFPMTPLMPRQVLNASERLLTLTAREAWSRSRQYVCYHSSAAGRVEELSVLTYPYARFPILTGGGEARRKWHRHPISVEYRWDRRRTVCSRLAATRLNRTLRIEEPRFHLFLGGQLPGSGQRIKCGVICTPIATSDEIRVQGCPRLYGSERSVDELYSDT